MSAVALSLWSPFRLRGLTLLNRFVMLPHWTGLETPRGEPTDDLAIRQLASR